MRVEAHQVLCSNEVFHMSVGGIHAQLTKRVSLPITSLKLIFRPPINNHFTFCPCTQCVTCSEWLCWWNACSCVGSWCGISVSGPWEGGSWAASFQYCVYAEVQCMPRHSSILTRYCSPGTRRTVLLQMLMVCIYNLTQGLRGEDGNDLEEAPLPGEHLGKRRILVKCKSLTLRLTARNSAGQLTHVSAWGPKAYRLASHLRTVHTCLIFPSPSSPPHLPTPCRLSPSLYH